MNDVILYTQPGCPQCRMVHILLDKKKVKYSECKNLDLMKEKGIAHTPALEINGQIIQGKELFNWINGR